MTSNGPTVGNLLQYLGHNVAEQYPFLEIPIAVPVRMRVEEDNIVVIKLENGKSMRIHCVKP